MAELKRVDQVAVVRERERALRIVQDEGLCIFARRGTGCRIPDVADCNVSLQGFQLFPAEILIDKTHALDCLDTALRTTCVADRDAAALLPAVLQRKEPIVDGRCDILTLIEIIDAENATFLM